MVYLCKFSHENSPIFGPLLDILSHVGIDFPHGLLHSHDLILYFHEWLEKGMC